MNNKFIGLIALFILPIFAVLAEYNHTSPETAPVVTTPEVVPKKESKTDLLNKERPRGQLLYENHCHVCHDKSVHSRAGHRAHNKDDIKYWVTRWSTELKLDWSNQDIDDVVEYLHHTYYQSEKN